MSVNLGRILYLKIRLWLSQYSVHLKHLTSRGLIRDSRTPRHWDRAILRVDSCTGFVQVLANKHGDWCKFGRLKVRSSLHNLLPLYGGDAI